MSAHYHLVIILCGGDINPSNLPIATSASNAMIPVNGKPVIGWILDDLAQKKVARIIIVTQSNNGQLRQYVQWAFRGRLNIEFALLAQKGNILQSLATGLDQLDAEQEVTLILGDTFIAEPYPNDPNYVIVSTDFDDPRNWCLAQKDDHGYITQYFDKENVPGAGLVALTGLYGFSDAEHLRDSCKTALQQSQRELSDVLKIYGEKYPVKAVNTSRWYDFGHMPHFLKAKRELLQTRYFNQISIEAVSGILRKTSTHVAKLCDESDWYNLLPETLKILTPRYLGKIEKNNTCTLVQEYYGYPNLAELYLYGNLDFEIWKVAIQNLMYTHGLLKSHPGVVSPDDAWYMYWEKTATRLTELENQDALFTELMSLESIYWNGARLDNLPRLTEGLRRECDRLSKSVEGAVIHGDFCLSNILYDLSNQLVRLIDPRGSFGKKGIYGDPRYDIAKLRHSLSGAYDFMVADLFTVENKGGGHFQTAICGGVLYEDIALFFDAEIDRAGYSLPDIQLIEGLLFLSMIPLHQDKPDRQIMMYLRAIQLFNTLNIKG